MAPPISRCSSPDGRIAALRRMPMSAAERCEDVFAPKSSEYSDAVRRRRGRKAKEIAVGLQLLIASLLSMASPFWSSRTRCVAFSAERAFPGSSGRAASSLPPLERDRAKPSSSLSRKSAAYVTCLRMAGGGHGPPFYDAWNSRSNINSNHGDDGKIHRKRNRKRALQPPRGFGATGRNGHLQSPPRLSANTTTAHVVARFADRQYDTDHTQQLLQRITQLEALLSTQALELQTLRDECRTLSEGVTAFAHLIQTLRHAGFSAQQHPTNNTHTDKAPTQNPPDQLTTQQSSDEGLDAKADSFDGALADFEDAHNTSKQKDIREEPLQSSDIQQKPMPIGFVDDSEIFGSAPSSVVDAADAAGAAILAAMLAGKQRMLVDVRDAELSQDPALLVQFIELAILPVAAGMEGLKSTRNRVKVVFPTVSQLLQYRKTMALSAPDVVALSILGFDPVEKNDNLVLIIAPSPDNEEGLAQMNDLLQATGENDNSTKTTVLRQPVVVLNHHMIPISGPAADFTPVYHLRLLSVHYVTGDDPPAKWGGKTGILGPVIDADEETTKESLEGVSSVEEDILSTQDREEEEDAALEAAMVHAHELSIQQGMTRAMVIRAYPRPWHVFVDTSPHTDADFEVAATFDEEPSQDDVHYAIVECLEGSEREDELVAHQMQQALDAGQLKKVSEMLGLAPQQFGIATGEGDLFGNGDDEDDDMWLDDWDPFDTDTV